MLDLDAGVHLDEVDGLVLIDQELHGPRTVISDGLPQRKRILVQLVLRLLRQVRGGGYFDHLLKAALYRAVALEEVHQLTVAVAQELHLDVAGVLDEFFQEDRAVTEGFFRFATGLDDLVAELLLVAYYAHPTAAASGGRLNDDGVPDARSLAGSHLRVTDILVAILNEGHAYLTGELLGGYLVPQLVHALGRGTHKFDPRLQAGAGEVHVLRQEAVTGVDSIHLLVLRQLDDGLDVDVGPQGLIIGADLVAFVGLVAV